ncbi:hypothetical protein J9B83_06410 [Marinomonas sp. A79]|uniref:Uncharacterized protein n=1 Tax=Marinomonas vulgaris TaxID=2823372 RepID=A0ABS5HAT9_9GAMM|nr:hypothetical protein [Marinomonas vulgaris]MBR7888572.1 hypothetical protein [Marinomonas vulgaris]
MKTFNKALLAVIAASTMSTAAFASSDDTAYDRLQTTKAGLHSLGQSLENMGANVDTSVDLSGANTLNQKEAVYSAKYAELQTQFNDLRAQSAE